jgi:hypothetical protein
MVAVLLVATGATARAGIFFNRKPKQNPVERVPVLIQTLRTEPDEHKRSSAAEELRNFDATTNPEIVAALAEAALRDPQAGVRIQAIISLGKIRPVNSRAGWTLEQAVNDPVVRVQIQARGALVQYRMAGYRSGTTSDLPPAPRFPRTEEPPLAPPLENEVSKPLPRLPVQPLKPTTQPPSGPMPSGPAVMPVGQPTTPLVPASAPNLKPAPQSSDGPELTLPK